MKLNEITDITEFDLLTNPLGAVSDMIGATKFRKSSDNKSNKPMRSKSQNDDNAKWCANPANKKNPNYKKIC